MSMLYIGVDTVEIDMRAIGFGNTFATLIVADMAFRSGVRRYNERLAVARGNLATADAELAESQLKNSMLKNALLKRKIAERDAAARQ
jgi:hypothetical protein